MAATGAGETLIEEIRRAGHSEPVFYQADLSSLAEVRKLAEAVLADHTRLDVFVSNAGIGSQNEGPARQTSRDGHELRFAVNYLSGFLLAHLLLPLLKAGGAVAHRQCRFARSASDRFRRCDDHQGLQRRRAYAQSKLAQIMFTIDLAEQLKGSGVTVNSLHPATYMNTTMVRAGGVTPISTVEQGGEAILHLVCRRRCRRQERAVLQRHERGARPIRRPMTRPPASGCARSASN